MWAAQRAEALRISIHAPRAGGDHRTLYQRHKALDISIHAPRAGGDGLLMRYTLNGCAISIHAPRAGGDRQARPRETHRAYFNPRPPCGGRQTGGEIMSLYDIAFQSTPPVRGATPILPPFVPVLLYFNPRPPCGGRRGGIAPQQAVCVISIHAPRAGSDDNGNNKTTPSSDFNPRPPCGERLCSCRTGRSRLYFNPRPPCGERPFQ